MSSEPLLSSSITDADEEDSHEMSRTTNDHDKTLQVHELRDSQHNKASDSDTAVAEDDHDAPPGGIVSRKQHRSDLFTIICAGCALISDGYANSLMTLNNVALRILYPRQYTAAVSTRVSNALLVGEIIGQLTIGLTCDYMGRKTAIILTTSMIIVGLIMSAASNGVTVSGLFWMLTISRGITGFGTGGEYPASSTSASESANAYTLKRRGPIFILVTNLPLSFGVPLASSIFLIVLQITTTRHLNILWRVCFGIGIIFPVTVFYWRITMVKSKLYSRGAIKRKVPYLLVVRYYWKTLIGTCGAWFLYDFVTIPNAVFSGNIISTIVPNNDIQGVAEWQLLLGTIALPGVVLGALLCDKIGRKNIMMIGFAGYLVFGLVLGCAYKQISGILPLFVVLYGVMLSMGNFGPANMVGLMSSESYATAVRGTCYGLSAAMGKTGAAVGVEVFQPIQQHLGMKWTFVIAAIVGFIGILVTYFFIPDLKGEDLSFEDAKFKAYLMQNGWKGTIGDEDLKERDLVDASQLDQAIR